MTLRGLARRLGFRGPDEFTDLKLRSRFKRDHAIDVGLYSYGCFDRSRVDPNTTIGRYCSFAQTAVVLNRNHGVEFLGTTPYLYNSSLKLIDRDAFDYASCDIGDDVWVGHNAVLAPSCRRVGRGAVIGAGAVVTKDVPPYAVVAGAPAQMIRSRFDPDVIGGIEATRWWEWDLAELRRRLRDEPDLVLRPASHFSSRP
jgi:virginiamycin A acetyltransferase